MVLWGQLHVEVVRHQPAVAREDLGRVVDLTLESGRDLDGLHGAAEGACERPRDELLEPVLESLQDSHVASSPSAVPTLATWCQPRWNGSRARLRPGPPGRFLASYPAFLSGLGAATRVR